MDKKKKIEEELKNERAIIECAEKFGIVGDPTRMKICWLLCNNRELSVGEIADILGVQISVVSHSLKKLRKKQLVGSRRESKKVYYRLSDDDFNKILKKALI